MSNILTVGEAMALFVSEKTGSLDVAERFLRFVAGAEVNFSIGMTRLGHTVTYLSQAGEDPFGRGIVHFLKENGVDTSLIRLLPGEFTGMQWKEKVAVGDPEVYSLRRGSAASKMDASLVQTVQWGKYNHMHLTGIPPALSAGCRELLGALLQEAKKQGLSISYDPNLRPGLWPDKTEMVRVINELSFQADIVFPGISEARQLTGQETPEAMAAFYHRQGVPKVVIKLGTKGAYASFNGETAFYTPAFPVAKVVDTVGAGDGFAVGVVSGLLEGLAPQDAVRRGAAIGALAVMSPGDNDGLPDRDGLASYMEKASRQLSAAAGD
ncbi:MAG: sugar kinase [Anaeromusa sp.]|uniref:sugar kinase n=1 Tax=Sporomusaceae TaxID=1843490 RepID=UPI00036517C0|nr:MULTISPECIES: sugar kinase [Sporomusaceae]MEA4833969.1 sugar kinase [Anaeromusa sp.]